MKKYLYAGLATLLLSPVVSAHTVALGTVNAGAAGSVTLWLGSYHTNAPNEGSMTLNGVTQAFNMVSNAVPAGLIAGSNLFYALQNGGAQGQYDQPTYNINLNITRWQGVTFTGLAAGVYNYTITGMNTVNWADWNSSRPNWTGQLTIPRSSVAPVPEPGTLALLGLGLAGLGFARRRRA